MLTLPLVAELRRQFPALLRTHNGQPIAYFDGPAGTQVPQRVIDAMSRYLVEMNANHGGAFASSRASDALLAEAHQAAADLLGADDPDCIAFGQNMTSLTFALSRALGRTWKSGDEIIVTRLDHDANVTPWVLAARDAGAEVRFVEIRRDDCTLDLDDLRQKITPRTRLVAVGCASNATGTLNPVREICAWAKAAGALTFLDAVHYAPHALMDVAAWDCDFLACSAYKFFGPHLGMLWGRRSLLEELSAYKLRPAPNDLPGKWMTGTQSHEAIAGAMAAIDYLADVGRAASGNATASRRAALAAAFKEIAAYERSLAEQFLRGLAELPSYKLCGIASRDRLGERVPTFSITHERRTPRAIVEELDRHGMYAWHGNYYALQLSETLGREPEGMVRIGMVHYNTPDEVERLLGVLSRLA